LIPQLKQNETPTAAKAELDGPKSAKFPVFFPVSRESGQRAVRSGLHPPPSSRYYPIGIWYFPEIAHYPGTFLDLSRLKRTGD
jgi:hypothetical protein